MKFLLAATEESMGRVRRWLMDPGRPTVRAWFCGSAVDEHGEHYEHYKIPEEAAERRRIGGALKRWFEIVDRRKTGQPCAACEKASVNVGEGVAPHGMVVLAFGGVFVALPLCGACAGIGADSRAEREAAAAKICQTVARNVVRGLAVAGAPPRGRA